MVLTILIAAFAVWGVFSLLWAAADGAMFPFPRKDSILILPLSGDASRCQQTIRGCLRLRRRRGVGDRVIFVDRGLDPEAVKSAELLLRGKTYGVLCHEAQVPELIRWENEELGAGTD